MLVRQVQHDPAGDEDLQTGAAGQEVIERGGGLDHLLQVVQDEQRLARAQMRRELLDQGPVARVAQAERLGHRRHDESGIADRLQRDEADAVGEPVLRLTGDFEGEAGLADAARPDQDDERDLVAEQQAPESSRRPAGDR